MRLFAWLRRPGNGAKLELVLPDAYIYMTVGHGRRGNSAAADTNGYAVCAGTNRAVGDEYWFVERISGHAPRSCTWHMTIASEGSLPVDTIDYQNRVDFVSGQADFQVDETKDVVLDPDRVLAIMATGLNAADVIYTCVQYRRTVLVSLTELVESVRPALATA